MNACSTLVRRHIHVKGALVVTPRYARQELQEAAFDIVELRDPFIERPADEDGKSRWWVIVARKPQ